MQILKTILDSPKKSQILSQVTAEHFGGEDSLNIFNRIKLYIDSSKPIPSSIILQNDESLDDSARALISNPTNQSLSTEGDIEEALQRLRKYRKIRILYGVLEYVTTGLSSTSPQIEDILGKIETSLLSCRSDSNEEEMKHYSYHNVDELKKEIEEDLEEDVQKDVIPSGLKEFDSKTGLRRKNSLVIASVPGGGKSTLALQMAILQYEKGYNVCFCNYEMSELEVRYRILSNTSRINHTEINFKRLNKAKKQLIADRFEEWLASSKAGNRFTLFTPQRDLTMFDIGAEIKPYKYDVVYVDYISLLKSNPKKAMWENLGDHARSAKLVANNLNAAVILLAQYDDQQNKLKYSQAIQANANFVWAWEYGEKEKESDIIEIKQLKARNAPTYNFYLQKDFSICTFKDYKGPPPLREEKDNTNGRTKGKASGKKGPTIQANTTPPPPMPKAEKPTYKHGIPKMPQLI